MLRCDPAERRQGVFGPSLGSGLIHPGSGQPGEVIVSLSVLERSYAPGATGRA